jgi:transcriptional regulator with XRE-family HTH domain
MAIERRPVSFRRTASLVKKFASERYRHAYVSAHVRQFLARQIRALRGDLSQEEFADKLGMPQSSVSRLENPAKGMQLQTLFEVASKLDRAVVVRLVDFKTFLRLTNDQSEIAICPPTYAESPPTDGSELLSARWRFDPHGRQSITEIRPPQQPQPESEGNRLVASS